MNARAQLNTKTIDIFSFTERNILKTYNYFKKSAIFYVQNQSILLFLRLITLIVFLGQNPRVLTLHLGITSICFFQ